MAKSQKIQSIKYFHAEAIKLGFNPLLEISSKSDLALGVSLSAFNLLISSKNKVFSVESAFQSSKVFECGGPFVDLLDKTSLHAKKDLRLSESGRLIKFVFFNKEFPLTPKTFFYDWLYINAIYRNMLKYIELLNFAGFTDIEFNPKKSINCQAYSAALLVSMFKMGQLEFALESTENFLRVTEMEYRSKVASFNNQGILKISGISHL